MKIKTLLKKIRYFFYARYLKRKTREVVMELTNQKGFGCSSKEEKTEQEYFKELCKQTSYRMVEGLKTAIYVHDSCIVCCYFDDKMRRCITNSKKERECLNKIISGEVR